MTRRALIYLDGLAADLRDEDRFAHGEAWHPTEDRGLGTCAYCREPWPCPWQEKVDRISQQVAVIRALLIDSVAGIITSQSEDAALTVARHFDEDAFACDFGGQTAINLPNLEQVIPLEQRP